MLLRIRLVDDKMPLEPEMITNPWARARDEFDYLRAVRGRILSTTSLLVSH